MRPPRRRAPEDDDPRRRRRRSIAARVAGVVMLGLAWYMGQLLKLALTRPPPHPATVHEFMLALASFVLASGGGLLLVEGARLFGPGGKDRPRRP